MKYKKKKYFIFFMSIFSFVLFFLLYSVFSVFAQIDLNSYERFYLEKIKKDPDNIDLNYDLGLIYLRQGKKTKALDQFHKVAFINPKDTDALLQLGQLLRNQGRLKIAEELLERCVKEKPEKYNAWYQLGLVKSDLLKINDSILCMEKCLQYTPREQNKKIAQIYYYMGILYLNIRNKEKAIFMFDQLKSIDSELSKDLHKLIQMWN